MNLDAVRRDYHERLRAGDAGAWHARVQRMARDMGVTYGERTVCHVLEPLFVEQTRYELILQRAELCVSALKKAAAHARAEPAIWKSLGFSADEEALLEIDGGYLHHDQVARLDSFLDEDGEPMFLEYNGESPGGIAYGDSLGRAFDALEPIQETAAAHGLSRRPVVPEVVRTLRASYYRWAPANGVPVRTEPQVAIIDLADIPTIGEFEIFKKAFENDGMACRIGSPEELHIRDGELYCDDFRIDIVYRRLLTTDLLRHYTLDHPLVEAMRRRLAFVANGFGGYLLSHKGLFAVLSDPATRPANLSTAEAAAVTRAMPWTRILASGDTIGPAGGAPRPLAELAREAQDDLVLKRCLGYGGQDVCLGWTVSGDEWKALLDKALTTPHILQSRLHIPRTAHPTWQDGELRFLPFRFDIDPYILSGHRAHGLGIRLAANDLLNVASGAGSAIPAYILSSS